MTPSITPVRNRAPRRPGVLAVDEGTTGTRAGVVLQDGSVARVAYRPIGVDHPDHDSVEQDAAEIWTATLEVCREALAAARADGVEVTAVALSTQRATAVLWDRETGRPLAPAVVWQDRRYAGDLLALEADWDADLLDRTGRPVGSRSPFLWAARQIAGNPRAREAAADGRLLFGTVDTWLAWNLTGGRAYATTPTNACSTGGYLLREHAWHTAWIERLGFPVELLPELRSDDEVLGVTDEGVLGLAVPIAASMGDQHAALIALGGLAAGDAMCMYGTGTFADAATGTDVHPPVPGADGVLTHVGRREGDTTHFSLEAYCSTTGSALRWFCEDLGFFQTPAEISELAAKADSSGGAWFVPALAGVRTPRWRPRATAALSGLTLATGRAQLARAVLEGIAHSVCDLVDGVTATTGSPLRRIRVGGGVAGSDTLMQIQADLIGLPLERDADSATASLRGTAYLAGARLGLWPSLKTIVEAQPIGRVFEPALGPAERDGRRAEWRTVLAPRLAGAAGEHPAG
ncbi:FGGY family carbohydrate kinase [Actinomadura harenae]|uniref:ATP:glycerol 3-phosphotransferase n=1 Tax=Actinomadura harenae TaxID=2483351 RepID=A0A3M2LK71_9ACTN|nr:FGGY family carbohydrate kinase [Actinomadura harenae]RMI37872.1 carbohydrate kinase [Actinomadura harenae]